VIELLEKAACLPSTQSLFVSKSSGLGLLLRAGATSLGKRPANPFLNPIA
jgi:hypothetical protein